MATKTDWTSYLPKLWRLWDEFSQKVLESMESETGNEVSRGQEPMELPSDIYWPFGEGKITIRSGDFSIQLTPPLVAYSSCNTN